ncbi:ketoacyl-synt-domain-containing protein [Anaeromyces robustus]|uniref:Ketoacyl-synt-domain-containing protein n=1 Tax=Anaeromyces robustus TaxID=1754192 RepID=A0A1Y1WZ20_9FUNG|nr:ketoacyl-synt-domain-containing protein [Anaeromyces robustus]|eukprot:ORX78811.1 ketoacyl-synt-domain-containing protein [Anaeromyces robustus]
MVFIDKTEYRSSKELERKLFLRDEDEETKRVYAADNMIDRINIRFSSRKDNVAIVAKENILLFPFKGVPSPEYPDPWLTVSFKEFHSLIKALAYVLKKRYDFRVGDRVGITANTLPMTQLYLYALFFLRCVVVLIPPKLGNDVKQYWVRHNDIRMIFYDFSLRISDNDEENQKLNDQGEWTWPWTYPLTEEDAGLSAGEEGIPMCFMYNKDLCNEIYQTKLDGKEYYRKGDRNDVLMILGTSSTSQAIIKNGQCSKMKFVTYQVTRVGTIYQKVLMPNVKHYTNFYLNCPFHHGMGANNAVGFSIVNGGPLVYHTQKLYDVGFIPEIMLDDMTEVNAVNTLQFPFHYEGYKKLFDENHPKCPIWAKYLSKHDKHRIFKFGGALLNPVVKEWYKEKFGIHIVNDFGSSEGGNTLVEDIENVLPGEEGYFKRIPWVDFCLKPLNENEPNIGELYTHSNIMTLGYVGRAKPGEFYDSPIPGMTCDIDADTLFTYIDGVKYYKTNDVFMRSPVSGKYKFVTRMDGILAFSTGLKMNPIPFEETITDECDDVVRCCLLLNDTLTEVICFVEPNWNEIIIDGKKFDTSIEASTLDKDTIKSMKKQAQQQIWNSIYKVLMDDSKSLTSWAKQLTINNVFIIDYGENFPSTDKGSLSRRVAKLKYSNVLKYISKLISGEISEIPEEVDEEKPEENKDISNSKEQNNENTSLDTKKENEQPLSMEEEEEEDKVNSNIKSQEEINEEIEEGIKIIYQSIKEIIPSTPSYEEFNPERPFNLYGIDSLATVKLTNVLSRKMGKRYSPAILFNYGNSLELAKFITNNENKKNTTNTKKDDLSAKESIPRSLNEGGVKEKIAIIGMSLRLPGSINSAKSFWMALAKGKNCVLPPVKNRDLHHGYVNKPSDQLNPGEHNIPYIGCYDTRSNVAKPSQFDAEFFNCLPDEALALDPRHRWVLETSWEALENAGIPPNSLEDSLTGVFVGMSQDHEYADLLAERNIIAPIAAHSNTQSGIAGRLSYFYRLYGPSLTMDTACSTGGSAIHTAVRSLQNRDCNLSIVSCVRYMYTSKTFYKTCAARMTSPHGRCATFDKDADGFASGEGCVCFVLKRLDDAIRDNDHILSVIIGTSSGQSGLRQSISAPSSEGQAINIKRAMEIADIKPEDVSYVEAHGTGTPLGDALEIHSLNQVYAGSHNEENPLVVGSVKTNIGHTGEVAGLASIAKVILAMQHKHIPKNLHFNTLNPEIDIESIPIKIPTKTIPWTSPVPNKPLIAQVSSFGLQGSIVHLFLEEYIPKEQQDNESTKKIETETEVANGSEVSDEEEKEEVEEINENDRENHILTISTKSYSALNELSNSYMNILEEMEDENKDIRDLCYTSNIGREHFNDYRISAYGKNATELYNHLEEALEKFEEKMEVINKQKENETNNMNNSKKPNQILNVYSENIKQGIINDIFKKLMFELYIVRSEFKKVIEFCDNYIYQISNKEFSLIDYLTNENNVEISKEYQNIIILVFYCGLSKILNKDIDCTQPVNVGNGILGEIISILLNGGINIKKAITLVKLISNDNANEELLNQWYESEEEKGKEYKLRGNVYCSSQQKEFKTGEVIPKEYYLSIYQKVKKNEDSEEGNIENITEYLMNQYGKKCKNISIFGQDSLKNEAFKESFGEKTEDEKYNSQITENEVISFFNEDDEEQACIDANDCVKKILPRYISEMYNSGNNIFWNNFHQRINNRTHQKYSVHKIDLPNYPFQRSTFWPPAETAN